MKKVTFLTSLCALATSVVFGQLVNGDLETWSVVGGYDTPTGWATSNAALGTTATTVTKSTDFHSGAFAAKLEGKQGVVNVPPFGPVPVVVPGLITTGQLSGTSVVGGQAYTTKSISLTGYYKYTPSGADLALIEVSLFKRNSSTNKRDRIAYGKLETGAEPNYTLFDIKLVYDPAFTADPDSQLITISSSKSITAAVANSLLYVDHVEFTGIVTGINESNITANSSAYPNPAVNELTITTDEKANSIALYDIAGRMMDEVAVENKTANVNTSAYAKGIYYYTVLGINNAMMSKGKFAIVK